jgi:putative oxidoreductase
VIWHSACHVFLQQENSSWQVPMSTNAPGLEVPLNGTLWVVQVLGGILAVEVGLAKVFDNEQMVQTFAVIGIGQWFRYVTGLIDFASAILLLIPPLAGIGALLLVVTMTGSILANFVIIGGSQVLPIGLLIVVSVVAWGRKETTLRLLGLNRT